MDNATAQTTQTASTDNSNTQTQQTQQTQTTQAQTQQTQTQSQQQQPVGWKKSLSPDLQGAPFMSKFEDTQEGMLKAFESHANLEKLLGNEKVPIPKGPEDTEGWARYRTAMKVPDKPEGYALPDAKLPESLKGAAMDKGAFAKVMHANHATQAQATAMWNALQEANIGAYNKHLEGLQAGLDKTINILRQEWGNAYDANVQLGEAAIKHIAGDNKEMADFLSATLLKDPNGVRFLKKVGDHFAENKLGDFNVKRFAVSPEEAQAELNEMMNNIKGPYFNEGKSFSQAQQDAAIARANDLRAIIAKSKQQR